MPKRAVPGWLALGSAAVAEWAAGLLTGRTPAATREGVRLALRSGPFDSRKARAELGYAPRPLQDALADAVAWLSSVGATAKQCEPDFDFAEGLAEVVHPEAVAEQIAASPQRTEPFGGVARQARHGEQLHRALPQASEHAAKAHLAVGTKRSGDQVGQRAVGRIAHHPHGGERQSVLGGERGGDMGFHVDGQRAGCFAQGALCSGRHHRAVDAGDVGHDHALRMIREARGETMSNDRRSGVAAIRCGDAGRHDHVAGHKRGIEAAGDADADDGTAIRLHPRVQQRPQPRGVAAGHHGGHAGPGSQTSLGRHPGHNQHWVDLRTRPGDGAGLIPMS